jgi:transposase
MPAPESMPDDIDALRAALAAEQVARREAEARACGAEALVLQLKLLIAKLKHDKFGASSERGRKLIDQLELQLDELVTAASEAAAATENSAPKNPTADRPAPPARKPVRAPLPAHLPRERVVVLAPSACPCCGGKLSKLGEDITETLEVIPRQWKVVQTVRERFSCRSCEVITQPPAPFHPIIRGRAGPNLLAMILEAKFGQHLPLNRQSESFAREGIELSVSTIADWVGTCTAMLAPLVRLIDAHVLAAARLHGDDTTVPLLARDKTVIARVWTYVRDDRPFGGPAPPAAMRAYSNCPPRLTVANWLPAVPAVTTRYRQPSRSATVKPEAASTVSRGWTNVEPEATVPIVEGITRPPGHRRGHRSSKPNRSAWPLSIGFEV